MMKKFFSSESNDKSSDFSALSSAESGIKSSSSENVCKVDYPEEPSPADTAAKEPQYVVTEVCEEVGACEAMVADNVSTWHFVREDNFGDDMEYSYSISSDGKTLAFSAAKSTCEDGNGNKNKTKACTKDSVLVVDTIPWPPQNVDADSKYDASANTLTDLRDNHRPMRNGLN